MCSIIDNTISISSWLSILKKILICDLELFKKDFNWCILQHNNIHLLDRTKTNIIFIWSVEVILGEVRPSPNITLPEQINMMLVFVLSFKRFIILAHVVRTRPSHILMINTKTPCSMQCTPCTSLRIVLFIFWTCGILSRSNWLRCDGIKSVLSQTSFNYMSWKKWINIQLANYIKNNARFMIYNSTVQWRNISGFKLIYYKYWMSLDSWINLT